MSAIILNMCLYTERSCVYDVSIYKKSSTTTHTHTQTMFTRHKLFCIWLAAPMRIYATLYNFLCVVYLRFVFYRIFFGLFMLIESVWTWVMRRSSVWHHKRLQADEQSKAFRLYIYRYMCISKCGKRCIKKS